MAEREPATEAEILRLEHLGRLGWPALETGELDGWQLGSSGVYTRRANSVAPERDGALDLEARILRVEAWYGARGRPAVFKLTTAAQPAGLDETLAARGYTTEGETLAMTLDLEACSSAVALEGAPSADVIRGRVDDAWFDASVVLSRVEPSKHADYRAILDRCVETCDATLFGQISEEGTIVSAALGCITGDTVSFVSVATDPDRRGKRYAESIMRSIFYAAEELGARCGLLNVEAPNGSARALYGRLGFVERYRYWYREAPGA